MNMLQLIWVFTVCKKTPLGVSRIQRVKKSCVENYRLLSIPHSGDSKDWLPHKLY